jgi:hypothetical protein
MNEKSILIIGDAGTGKTHYGVQLMLRLEEHACAARYFRSPENVEPFREAMKLVSAGRSANHTTGENTRSVVLPVEFSGGQCTTIEWPEYAGERLSHLVRQRHAGKSWAEAAGKSDAWLLFVRHDKFGVGRDMLNRPVNEWMESRRRSGQEAIEWLPQVQVIEMLQMLLYLRRASRREPLAHPRLAIALSLYDTVPKPAQFPQPGDALRALTPLLASFIETNWEPSSYFAIGLSALGRSLAPDTVDEDFVDRGPTQNGWVIKPDGTTEHDLTWPLVQLLKSA